MGDALAIDFSVSFYDGVGKSTDYKRAFDLAVGRLKLNGSLNVVMPVFKPGSNQPGITYLDKHRIDRLAGEHEGWPPASRIDTDQPRLVVPRLTDINGEQHGQLAEALADAFDQQSLTEMVRVKLNQTLAKIFANALPAMLGWIPFGKRGPRENKTADEALYAEQQAHMADAVEKLRRLALGE